MFVRVQRAAKINYYRWRICHGEPQNLANWPAEFGKICRGKLWSLVISTDLVLLYTTTEVTLHFVELLLCVVLV